MDDMAEPMAERKKQNVAGVVAEYSGKLFRFIRSRVPTTEDAEDIIQDVWYQFSKVVEIESIGQVSGWLYRVARNRIIDRSKKKKEALIDDFGYVDADGNQLLAEFLMVDDQTPETETLREMFWEALFEALEKLPENQKNVFVWNELEDQTFQEISDRTGVNIKTLISRKRYAIQHLRLELQAFYNDLLEDE